MRNKFYIFIGCFLFLTVAKAQNIDVKSGFLEDSLNVGKIVNYWITVKYNMGDQVLLPDSTHKFTPFEYHKKKYFSSKNHENQIIDSAIYSLQSFEIDSIQSLSLPVVFFQGNDSSTIYSPVASILFQDLVTEITAETDVKSNTQYFDVIFNFNVFLWLIVFIVLIIIVVIVYFIYGKKIKNYFIIKKLRKSYTAFSDTFGDYIHKLRQNPNVETAEKALLIWKIYFENLEKCPIRKLTTKEILALEITSKLDNTLPPIDRYIYGNIEIEDLYKYFQNLEDYTQSRYSLKLQSLKDGVEK